VAAIPAKRGYPNYNPLPGTASVFHRVVAAAAGGGGEYNEVDVRTLAGSAPRLNVDEQATALSRGVAKMVTLRLAGPLTDGVLATDAQVFISEEEVPEAGQRISVDYANPTVTFSYPAHLGITGFWVAGTRGDETIEAIIWFDW